MKRLLLLIVVAVLGYAAWPYWCAYSLAQGKQRPQAHIQADPGGERQDHAHILAQVAEGNRHELPLPKRKTNKFAPPFRFGSAKRRRVARANRPGTFAPGGRLQNYDFFFPSRHSAHSPYRYMRWEVRVKPWRAASSTCSRSMFSSITSMFLPQKRQMR